MMRERAIKTRPINQNPEWLEIAQRVTNKDLKETEYLTDKERANFYQGVCEGLADVSRERLFWARFWGVMFTLSALLNLAWMRWAP